MTNRAFLIPALTLLVVVLAQRPAMGQETRIVDSGVVYENVNNVWTITGISSTEDFPADGVITLKRRILVDVFGDGMLANRTVKAVADRAFYGKSEIQGVVFEDGTSGITTIGSDAFEGCSNLTTLTLPSTITTLSANAFGRGENLRWVDCRSVAAMADGEWMGNPDHTPEMLGLPSHALLYMPKGCAKTAYPYPNVVFTDDAEARTCLHFRFPRNKDFCVPWNFTADEVSAYPSLGKDEWAYSVCLPYEQPVPEGASVYALKSRGANGDMTDVCFKKISGNMEAGLPYLVVVDADGGLTFQHQGTIPVPDTDGAETLLQTASVNGVSLRGTFRRINFDEASAGNYYVLQTENLWKRVGGEYTHVGVPPFRAYLTLDQTQAASVSFDLIDDTDAIAPLPTSRANVGDAWWHTLQGQRLPSAPSRPGVYIHRGRKVAVMPGY